MFPPILHPHFHAALDRFPSGRHLDHIEEFGQLQLMPAITRLNSSGMDSTSATPLAPVLLSIGLPSVPAKLVERKRDRLFIEMFDLLTQKLISAEYSIGDHTTGQKQKQYEVTTIEWVQCSGIYIAIVSQKET